MGSTFEFNPAGLEQLQKNIVEQLQPQANEQIRALVRDVDAKYDGETVEQVIGLLNRRMETELNAVPNPPVVREIAENVVARTVVG